MAHWDAKFSIGSYLVLNNIKYIKYYPHTLIITNITAYNFYKVKNLTLPYIYGMEEVIPIEMDSESYRSFKEVESHYKLSIKNTFSKL